MTGLLPAHRLAPLPDLAGRSRRFGHRSAALLVLWAAAIGSGRSLAAEPAYDSRHLSPDPTWHASRGAFCATRGDLAGLLGNPAALASIPQSRIGLSHMSWGESLAREWLAAGVRLGGCQTIAGDFGVLHAPALNGYDPDGLATGTFRATEWNAGLTGAREVGEGIAVGLGARYFRLDDPSAPIGSLAGSAGLVLRRGQFALGGAVNDLGSAVSSAHGSWGPPSTWTAGVQVTDGAGRGTLGAALVTRPGRGSRLAIGAALRPASGLELQGGYALDAGGARPVDPGWGTGLSWSQSGITAAYAVQSSGSLGLTHQFGLSAALSSGR